MDDAEMDAQLARIRHRDALCILIVSAVVGLPLLVMFLLGVGLGSSWDQVLAGALGLAVFAAVTAVLHLHRNRRRYSQVIRTDHHH
jgi:Kef-type K+ transport system membrane component KefB